MRNGNIIQKVKSAITSETEIKSQNKRLIALFLLAGAIVFGCMYYGLSRWEYWTNPLFFLKQESLRFRFPTFIHCLLGLVICAPLYIRNILPFKSFSVYYTFTAALNITLFAVLAQLIIGPSYTFRHDWISTLLILALALTWLGIRSVAGISWILVFVLAAFNLVKSSQELRHWGLPFLLCSFLAILFQAQRSPKELFETFKLEFKGASESKLSDSIKENVHEAVEKGAAVAKGSVTIAAKTLVK